MADGTYEVHEPKRALVLDGCPQALTQARTSLESLGFVVSSARDADEALRLCLRLRPAFVLADWSTPRLNGAEFVRTLRMLPDGEGTIILFCSDLNRASDVHELMRSGADEFIAKPVDRDLLLFKLQQAGLAAALS